MASMPDPDRDFPAWLEYLADRDEQHAELLDELAEYLESCVRPAKSTSTRDWLLADRFKRHAQDRRSEAWALWRNAVMNRDHAAGERRRERSRRGNEKSAHIRRAASPAVSACERYHQLRDEGHGYGEAISQVAAEFDRDPRTIQRYLSEENN